MSKKKDENSVVTGTPIGFGWTLQRISDGKWYHPGGGYEYQRWRDVASADGRKGVITRKRNDLIKESNGKLSENDFRIVRLALVPVES